MTLKPLPPQAIVAARLRKKAAELILDAEELEATYRKYRPKRHIDFKELLREALEDGK